MTKRKVVQIHLSYLPHKNNQVVVTVSRRTSEVLTVSRVYLVRLDGDTVCRINRAVKRALSVYVNISVFPDMSFRFERL